MVKMQAYYKMPPVSSSCYSDVKVDVSRAEVWQDRNKRINQNAAAVTSFNYISVTGQNSNE
jgi:hypothetical protein